MYTFHLIRTTDVSGVSGTGVVADGVEFSDGTCVMRWRGDKSTTAIYDNIDNLQDIHGHDGSTLVYWCLGQCSIC